MEQANGLELMRMEAEHLDAVAHLEQECFHEPWSRQVLESELARGMSFWVALKGGRLAGYVGWSHVLDEGYLGNLAVAAQQRGQGVATALLSHVLQEAAALQVRFVTLEVRPSNLAARKVYERLGFEQVGRRKGFYESPREDALLLTCTLPQAHAME